MDNILYEEFKEILSLYKTNNKLISEVRNLTDQLNNINDNIEKLQKTKQEYLTKKNILINNLKKFEDINCNIQDDIIFIKKNIGKIKFKNLIDLEDDKKLKINNLFQKLDNIEAYLNKNNILNEKKDIDLNIINTENNINILTINKNNLNYKIKILNIYIKSKNI